MKKQMTVRVGDGNFYFGKAFVNSLGVKGNYVQLFYDEGSGQVEIKFVKNPSKSTYKVH